MKLGRWNLSSNIASDLDQDSADVGWSVVEEEVEIVGTNRFQNADSGEKKDFRPSLLNDEDMHESEATTPLKKIQRYVHVRYGASSGNESPLLEWNSNEDVEARPETANI